MPTTTRPVTTNPVRLYLLAGVGTAPTFMQVLQDELRRRLQDTGFRAEGGLLFPYDDWGRRMIPQIREVWHDIRLPLHRLGRSIGGRAAVDRILRDMEEDEGASTVPIILVGHSGGGTAGLHAAHLLRQRLPQASVRAIVMIGSPRSPVPPELAADTAYCYAARMDGRRKDPVCLAGSWRAWPAKEEAGGTHRSWRKSAFSPGSQYPLPLLGGHPDYFRTHLKDTAGRTNLEITLDAVWGFIEERLKEQ